jgi:hypothetical protein
MRHSGRLLFGLAAALFFIFMNRGFCVHHPSRKLSFHLHEFSIVRRGTL